jgi:hypothetical protein
MEQLALSCYGVAVRIVDTAGVDICRVREALPPQFVADRGGGSASVSYAVGLVTALPDGTTQREYRVSRDGTEVFTTPAPDDLVQRLRQDIDANVAQRSRRMLFVHAAVVGWRGWAIVIPGRSHSGKSTLVAECVRRGALYYSDEYAVLDDEGNVHPYSRPPVLREPQTVDDLRLVREDEPMKGLPIALIITGGYRPDTTWRPAVVRGVRAVLPLIEGTVLARDESARMLRVVSRVASNAVALAGPRGEAGEVAAQLLELVDDATASRAFRTNGPRSESLAGDLSGVAELRLRSRSDRRMPTARRLVSTRYVRMTDFLPADDHDRLLEHALASEADFQASGIVGRQGESALNYGARRSRTLAAARVEEVWAMFAPRLEGIVAGVRRELGIPWFRLGKVERQLTAHGRGGFFVPHVDTGHPVAATRRVSAVYYFHATPQRFTGGELRLYDTWVTPTGSTGAGTYSTLAPLDNSLVFFPSDAFHEVCTVRSETDAFADSRFTVTIWFHEERQSATDAGAVWPHSLDAQGVGAR